MAAAADEPSPGKEEKGQKDAAATAVKSSPVSVDAASAAAARDESNDTTPHDDATATATAAAPPSSSRPSDAAQPSAKKRRSGIQLNKDDHPEGHDCDSGDDDLNDEGGKRSDAFQRAPEDVLSKRKIVKVGSRWSRGGGGGNGNGGTAAAPAAGGAFGSVKLAPAAVAASTDSASSSSGNNGSAAPLFGTGAKVPTFGSAIAWGTTGGSGFGSAAPKSGGFGSGFGAVSSGFGALKSSTSADKAESGDGGNGDSPPSKSAAAAFGGAFGSASAGFGSLKSKTPTFTFGSAPKTDSVPSAEGAAPSGGGSGLAGTFAKVPSSSSASSPSKFPILAVVDTANGEQNEDCLCQIRAKLFRMVPEVDAPDSPGDGNEEAVLSVPASSGRMELVKAKKGDEGGESPEKAVESPEKSNSVTKEGGGEGGKKQTLVQKEAGIGPVRVLKRKPPLTFGEEAKDVKEEPALARVVQRQETTGGQATKVILNVRLDPKTCEVIRRGDKFVQLNAPNSEGTLESSLFKVRMPAEADTLEKHLKAMLGVNEKSGASS